MSKTKTTTAIETSLVAKTAAALAAIAKASGATFDRDDLPGGSSFDVEATITGTVDGQAFAFDLGPGVLSVDQDFVRDSTTDINPSQVIGKILSKLNTATRNRVILEILSEFEAGGLEVDDDMVNQAEQLRDQLRSKKQQNVRGSVKFSAKTLTAK